MLARLSRAIALCCAVALVALLFPVHAWADTAVVSAPSGTTISLEPLWTQLLAPMILTVFGTIITALIGWAASFLKARTGLDIDAKHREALHSAAMTGVNLALAKLGTKVDGLTWETKSVVIAQAIDWVETSVPQALAHFGVSASTLNDLVASKLTAALGTEAIADKPASAPQAASASPVAAGAALPKPA